MALIKCPECGRQVSDFAESCPDCGFPVKEYTLYNQKRVGVYCPQCGNYFIWNRREFESMEDKSCSFCGAQKRVLPPDDKEFGIFFTQHEERLHLCDRVAKEYVSKLPEFSQEVYENRLRKEAESDAEFGRKYGNSTVSAPLTKSSGPKCPVCGSMNTSKIGVLGRSTSIFAFGLASNKIGKNWKCHNCGNTW